MREFLNDDKDMAGAIVTDFSYSSSKKEGEFLDFIWFKLGDCRKTVELEFPVRDYMDKKSKKDVKKSLNKARRIQKHINKIVEVLEEEYGD